jgi:ketosteroid isomerase-like protein
MITTLPEPLSSYYAATNAHDAERAISVFAEDAVVEDENEEHRGREAIREWIGKTTRKYGPITVEPIDITQQGRTTVVANLVSGDFRGSPATLRYTFLLDRESILRLEIA